MTETKTETTPIMIGPCWVVLVDGSEIDHVSGGLGHFTESEASDAVGESDGKGVAKQLDEQCVTLACSQCGSAYDLDSDDRCVYHFVTLPQALADLSGTDWTISKSGKVHCPGCDPWGDGRG